MDDTQILTIALASVPTMPTVLIGKIFVSRPQDGVAFIWAGTSKN